jgi:hypothetical protein
VLDQRGQLLRAAVGFARCSMPSYDRALTALRTWLDSWSGIGRIAAAWRACSHPVQQSRNALIVFEARNLFAIGASLVGFSYMLQLVSSPGTFGALWGRQRSAQSVTVCCVYAWTKAKRQHPA